MSSRLNDHLTEDQLETLRDKVLAEIERIETKLAAENMHLNIANSGRDEVDSANDDIIKHSELRFTTRETLYLKKLKKTRPMFDGDEYGICEDCGSEITFQRLIARPTSTMCIGCKEESERDELQSFHGRKSKSLGQQINLSARA
ncbi:MAG: TraR/DksA family transcriptional regulator [Bacteriovoracaceae bacterium]|nr:TraR/DksA family transcriptional regulator [Bacteriovoracaceae bacterium]